MAQDPRALMRKAEEMRGKATGGFGFFGGRTEKFENAADLYQQAANAFRMQKQTKEAGYAFEMAADIQKTNLNEPGDAANSLTEAFKVYKKSDPQEAARVLKAVVAHYTLSGNFRRAATHEQNLAELYEVDLEDPVRAVEAYERAAGWYEDDNAEALANKLFLKVADLVALQGDYLRAVTNYEKVARSSVNNNLMRFSVKDYFFKSGLCLLANKDLVAVHRALGEYRDLDNGFASSREHTLLINLTEAVDAGEEQRFSDEVFQFDRVSQLDKWKTALLLRIKTAIEEQGDDFS